jgi:hypothetical protein
MTSQRFDIRLGARSRPLLRLFGVHGVEDAYVVVDDEAVHARFGWATADTPLANISGWRIEGPWRWITAIGIRRSVRDGDITFGGSPRGGVRMDFKEPIRIVRLGTPALYVSVEDLQGLGASLAERGIQGVDARSPGRS